MTFQTLKFPTEVSANPDVSLSDVDLKLLYCFPMAQTTWPRSCCEDLSWGWQVGRCVQWLHGRHWKMLCAQRFYVEAEDTGQYWHTLLDHGSFKAYNVRDLQWLTSPLPSQSDGRQYFERDTLQVRPGTNTSKHGDRLITSGWWLLQTLSSRKCNLQGIGWSTHCWRRRWHKKVASMPCSSKRGRQRKQNDNSPSKRSSRLAPPTTLSLKVNKWK